MSLPRPHGGGGAGGFRAPNDLIGGRCGGCRSPAGCRPQLHSHGLLPAAPPPRLPLTPRWPRSFSSRLPGAVPAACPLPWPARPRSPRAPALPWAPPPGGRMRGATRGPGAAGWGAGGRSTEGRSAARPAERAAPLAPAEGGRRARGVPLGPRARRIHWGAAGPAPQSLTSTFIPPPTPPGPRDSPLGE